MKNVICLIVLSVMLLGNFAYAEYSSDNLNFGFMGGFNIANVTGHAVDTKPKTGLCIGGYMNYMQNQYLSYQLELVFNGKGYRITGDPYYDTLNVFVGYRDLTYSFTYLEVPILTKFTFLNGDKASLFLEGGGFFGLRLDSKIRVENEVLALDIDLENSKGADLGYIIGGGLNLRAGETGWIFFEARYEVSLIESIQGEDQKSRILGFRAGYWF
ncbi:MAG: porin family protein [Candidatus Zixiibacteriota bacterium]